MFGYTFGDAEVRLAFPPTRVDHSEAVVDRGKHGRS